MRQEKGRRNVAAHKATYPSVEALPKLMTFRLSRLQARANAHAARLLKKNSGISLSEWRIFVIIETNGRITPTEIVRLTNFDKSLISRTIKGLQERGLICADTSDCDARSFEIDFTPAGLALFEKSKPVMRQRQQMFKDALTEEELEVLFRAFDKLDDALDEMEKKL